MLLAQQIVGEITDAGLAPGTSLPSERVMLENYGVARGTLREALRFLETQGVLTIRPGPRGGPSVAAPDHRTLARTIALLLQFAHAEFRAIVEVRQLLEPPIAALAAARGTLEQFRQIELSLEEMSGRVSDERGFLDENSRFHGLIAEASGNDLFGFLIASLGWITDGTALGVRYPGKQRRAVHRAHLDVYEAIVSRNADGAHAAMQRHLEEFATHLQRRYPHVLAQRLRWEHFQ